MDSMQLETDKLIVKFVHMEMQKAGTAKTTLKHKKVGKL